MLTKIKRILYRVQPISQIKKRSKRKREQQKRDEYYAAAREDMTCFNGYSTREWTV